jgi:diguanylate cyclase (GGDEF)-like protein
MANHTILIRRDLHEVHIEDSAAPIRDRAGHILGVVLVFHDVGEKRKLSNQLSYQATHDALTGLINRSEFERQLEELLAGATSQHTEHALLYLDLDQFKVVNDTCGHSAGDELLRQLTARIQCRVRESDTFARLGGDEFGILLENCPLDQAIHLANVLLNEVGAFHFSWLDKSFSVGVSIGLVAINDSSGNSARVLSAADTACYAAKDKGRNRVQVYSPDDIEMATPRNALGPHRQNFREGASGCTGPSFGSGHAQPETAFEICCEAGRNKTGAVAFILLRNVTT